MGGVAIRYFPDLICIIYEDIYCINPPSIPLYISEILSQSILKCDTFFMSLLYPVYFYLDPVYASTTCMCHSSVITCCFPDLSQHKLLYFEKVIYSQLYLGHIANP